MFVALRDLRFATGRFALMSVVVVLITLLVVLLSGLTAGLARESTSAITGLNADHLVFSKPAAGQGISFTESSLSRKTVDRWRQVPGVDSADPLGITTTKAVANGRTAALAAFGTPPGSPLAPRALRSGQVVLSDGAAAQLNAKRGSDVTVAGLKLKVAAVSGESSYSHTPVLWMGFGDWSRVSPGPGLATVIGLSTSSGADLAAADHRLGTSTVSKSAALPAIGSYTSENSSLNLMRGLLFAISALVIGAFFTVWTMQRSRDVAVLKALGARTGYLLRDALGQALLVLAAGSALGAGLAAGAGSLAASTVPFVLSPATVIAPAAVMILLGMFGAALAIRRVTSVDPLTALGSS